MTLEDPEVVAAVKRHYAPDGGAEREHNATPTTLGFGALHYAFVANLRPARVLVIGSRYGYVPAAIALALRANGTGAIDLVDANYSDAAHGFATAYGGIGYWDGDAAGRFAGLDLRDLVDVHVMRSADFFATCDRRYGYIYIDGDHSYEGSRFDFERASAVAEDGAVIALHDVLVTEPAFGVRQMLVELDPECFSCLVIPVWPGLALVQRRRTS